MGNDTRTSGTPRPAGHDSVEAFFRRSSRFWKDIYDGDDVYSLIHQRRRQIALGLVESLDLTSESRVLDAGCGAGTVSVALARRGFEVEAIDSVESMVDLARQGAEDAAVTERLRVSLMDVHRLEFDSHSFDLVLALGVLPWSHAPADAIREMARVVRPGGYVIANVDNSARLIDLLDPRFNPWVRPMRNALKAVLISLGLRRPGTPSPLNKQSRRGFNRLLASAGLAPIETATYGFGVFTFLGRPVFSEGRAVHIDRLLQRVADRGVPGLRSTGAQYLVLSQKQA